VSPNKVVVTEKNIAIRDDKLFLFIFYPLKLIQKLFVSKGNSAFS
jgi:hypothetical protein